MSTTCSESEDNKARARVLPGQAAAQPDHSIDGAEALKKVPLAAMAMSHLDEEMKLMTMARAGGSVPAVSAVRGSAAARLTPGIAPQRTDQPSGPAPSGWGDLARLITPAAVTPAALVGSLQVGRAAVGALTAEWAGAIAQMDQPSVFCTPEFIGLSYDHYLAPGDEPWIITVRQEGRLVGLLPLVRSKERMMGVPVGVLRHAGELGGDRPGLVHLVSQTLVWKTVFDVLARHAARWQVLELREVDEFAWPLGDHALAQWRVPGHYRVERHLATHAGYLSMDGDWERYMGSRSRNTRQAFRRRERQLFDDHPDARVEAVACPEHIGAAFERYLAMEQRGWKRDQGIGLWSCEREREFHRALLPVLARSGRASVWLLRVGETDIAGLVRFQQGGVCYERYAGYDPDYARYSPSTYLCVQALKASFETGGTESDVLGMPQPLEERPAISAWYPGERRTWRLRVVKPPLWLGWMLALKERIQRWRQRPQVQAPQAGAPAPTVQDPA